MQNTNAWTFPAKIDKRGRVQIPKNILDLVTKGIDKKTIFITTIERQEVS